MALSHAESSWKGRVDTTFLAATAGLLVVGSLAVVSAVRPMPHSGHIIIRHFAALAVGIAFFFFGFGFDYHVFEDQAKMIYAATLLMLVAVLVVGTTSHGHRSWLDFGFLSFQPAELARLFLILSLAAFLDRRERKIEKFSVVLGALALSLPVVGLILKQPDFSTALTFLPLIFGMLFCAGVSLAQLSVIMIFAGFTLLVPFVYTVCLVLYPHASPGSWPNVVIAAFIGSKTTLLLLSGGALVFAGLWRWAKWARLRADASLFLAGYLVLAGGLLAGIVVNRRLKPYQRDRFAAFIAPKQDLEGAAYHVRQSQIAIGSGGFLGKGLFEGTQSQLGFLPERHTDFIYAVIGEEMGFWGAVGVLLLYFLLVWRLAETARSARDRYGYLVCSGLAVMFGFELVLNVGMCVGLMPVAGIPLPLVSYGGSSLVIALWSLGIASNVHYKRYLLA